ncbi:multifunctional CCA tRNA nucleotidyl transferase/2'3'-cyclic phosphodiesterase/2'nucleotidase/phosphatase [Hydrogenophaga sp.]|uniref:multifunctional CCA tRNA nucleotidyl transferase/2'3'-cyclic phosphodiesterase/2'nucleotidase/phosphatase n=1 Tax=Hydrogenophaga sp. TaxID=1904254 RepID=UPI0019BB0BA9|nr:multifunctional CCA tRNA nucleotidyl transferase/2'3'-cyclic phosphodiesterase/2'nucleotidase/phosphatase [Hydrogenophaga sp.]MBD3892839.1 multifunctional CCA tRNA nucleotidyl transferase/2'3'-cyclic phosphodiesterase/2'nucleotidase/phosphatase [Hydrogenophaga sp.]
MKVYLVGGAVRDALLSAAATPTQASHFDRDWVVVGATPQAMQAQGFLPVGREFPVFLHPSTREEYALARTERSTAPGYHGFAFQADPSVTLEDDLARRDLTINAMAVSQAQAKDPSTAQLIDPYGGQRDLQARVLRHVTASFAEDPVRILRLARFAARLPDFSVAPETLALMRQMVERGEVDHLVPERVWQEIARGLMEHRPSRLLEVLHACGALEHLLPELKSVKSGSDSNYSDRDSKREKSESDPDFSHLLRVLDLSAALQAPLPVRFACFCHGLARGPALAELLRGVCLRWRVPRESRELAEVVARERGHIHHSGGFNAAALVRLLERCDALRRPQRFEQVLLACECDARAPPGQADKPYPPRARLLRALAAIEAVDGGAIAAAIARAAARAPTPAATPALGARIAEAVHAARCQALSRVWPEVGVAA